MEAALTEERLVSVDSHVHFSDDWIKARLRKPMHAVWDEANRKAEAYGAQVLRGGQKQLEPEDFVDPEAAKDPGHFTPDGKLAAMDRDGVYAEVIFPELAGAKIVNPSLMGDDWQEVFRGYNDAMADFAAHDPVRLMTAYQRAPSDTFRAQCGATFMYEPQGLKACYDYFGPDCLYWPTDFPHPATCWPNSRRQVVSQFAEAGIAPADRVKITSGNASRTFGLG